MKPFSKRRTGGTGNTGSGNNRSSMGIESISVDECLYSCFSDSFSGDELAYILSIGVLLLMYWFQTKYLEYCKSRDVRAKYKMWIQRAQHERDTKYHHVLLGEINHEYEIVKTPPSSPVSSPTRKRRVSTPSTVVDDDNNNNDNNDASNIKQDSNKKDGDDDVASLNDTSFTSVGGTSRSLSSFSAKEIRDAVIARELDPRLAVAVLSRRCRTFGRPLNAIAEELYEEASIRAEALHDLLLQEDEKGTNQIDNNGGPSTPTRGSPNRSFVLDDRVATTKPSSFSGTATISEKLLFGVPIAVKEYIAIKGTYSTGGLACRLYQRNQHDALIIQILKGAGAVPIATSNVPQLLMLPESVNHIWGRTSNPWDTTRTPGGSSGGDAALVAMSCVPLAVGSDIAGSIRVPASFCGVVGFKPSPTRMSFKGVMKPRLNGKLGTAIAIPSVIGPIARTVDDCALFMKAVLNSQQLFRNDLNVVPIPFDQNTYEGSSSKLKIGYFDTDEWFEPCLTSKRAVKEAVDALTRAGHTCIPFESPTDGWYNYGLLVAINAAEGKLRSFVEALEGEDMVSEYKTLLRIASLPSWLRWLASKVVDEHQVHLLSQAKSCGISAWDVWQLTAELLELRSKWSDAMTQQGIDALIHPSVPLPAFKHGYGDKAISACSYLFLANLLMWPSGAVPVTTIQPGEAHYDCNQNGINNRWDTIAKLASYMMKDSEGLPMGVCVMTSAHKDELCLRVMKEIEQGVEFDGMPSAYQRE